MWFTNLCFLNDDFFLRQNKIEDVNKSVVALLTLKTRLVASKELFRLWDALIDFPERLKHFFLLLLHNNVSPSLTHKIQAHSQHSPQLLVIISRCLTMKTKSQTSHWVLQGVLQFQK